MGLIDRNADTDSCNVNDVVLHLMQDLRSCQEEAMVRQVLVAVDKCVQSEVESL